MTKVDLWSLFESTKLVLEQQGLDEKDLREILDKLERIYLKKE